MAKGRKTGTRHRSSRPKKETSPEGKLYGLEFRIQAAVKTGEGDPPAAAFQAVEQFLRDPEVKRQAAHYGITSWRWSVAAKVREIERTEGGNGGGRRPKIATPSRALFGPDNRPLRRKP